MTISPNPAVNTSDDELIFSSFQKQLETYSMLGDPYMGLAGQMDPSGKAPAGITTVVPLTDRIASGTRTMIMPPETPAQMGDNHIAENHGETLALKTIRTYANSWDKVINRADPYTVLTAHITGREFFLMSAEQLKTFTPIQRGDYFRHAAIESYSQNITTQADGGPGLTARYNMHWYFNLTAEAVQPAYNSNTATFLANLMAAFAAAPKTDTSVGQMNSFNILRYQASQKWRVKRLGNEYMGKMVCFVGSRTATWLRNLSLPGSVGFVRRTTLSEKIADMAFSPAIGEVGDFILVEDPRCPIAVYDTSDPQNPTLSIVYAGVGTVNPIDAYNSSATSAVFELNVVAGQSAFTNSVISQPMYRDQVRDFERLQQVAVLAVEGMTITEFDNSLQANQTSASRVGQGAGIFATFCPGSFQ